MYMLFQKALYDVNSNLVYKKHIATRGKYIPDKASHVIYENLNKLNLDNYGFIVIDFISTAMVIASASNVPIIYFHLGLINLNDEALSDLRERVFWVDIDFEEDIESQIVTGFNNFFSSIRKYNKQYSLKYSLSNKSFHEILASILNKSFKLNR